MMVTVWYVTKKKHTKHFYFDCKSNNTYCI